MTNNGYIRVAAAAPKVHPADPQANAAEIIKTIDRAANEGVALLNFPELSLTGYTCADLFQQQLLIDDTLTALQEILRHTHDVPGMVIAIGAPLRWRSALYNCAIILGNSHIHGIVPKSYLPNYGEFYEKRWFASGSGISSQTIEIAGESVPFGTDLLFKVGNATVGVEICEDLWTPLPPSTLLALSGADVILNLSATDEVIGKHDYLLSLLRNQSGRLNCAYIYASAGFGESSTDLVYSGNAIIAENGSLLCESPRFTASPLMEVADIDLEILAHDRNHNCSFADTAARTAIQPMRTVDCHLSAPHDESAIRRFINPDPFVPSANADRDARCSEIISIQTEGLMRRLDATGCKTLVVGISGGLDSTLAILVAANAFRRLGLDPKGLIGVTMPGFGTTGRTYNNATSLVKELNATLLEINISAAVRQHFADIGHDEKNHDITYENSQARERTQILMDLANKYNGMVLGTGDLSELALGWCTYNGDQMSMYGVNASIPKTLVRHLVQWFADRTEDASLRSTLLDIVDTPISPELIPATPEGTIKQKTEDLVGPYRLHDFFLYNMLRYGFSPAKLYRLANSAFKGVYDEQTVSHWLQTFCRRFFRQQFKRSCMPDGPKVGSITLSPRGDWRMPSDASPSLWMRHCPAF